MKGRFRSIRRAIRRGHLEAEVNTTTKSVDIFRKANTSGRKVLYDSIKMPD